MLSKCFSKPVGPLSAQGWPKQRRLQELGLTCVHLQKVLSQHAMQVCRLQCVQQNMAVGWL